MKPSFTTVFSAILTASMVGACAGPGGKGPGRGGPGQRPEHRPEMTPERKAEMFERFTMRWDHDGDGSVTCADVAFERAQLFARLDADKNDGLASGEYRFAKFEDKSFMFHLFSDVDADRSGEISLDELKSATHSRFNSIDRDGNCIVTPEETAAQAGKRLRGPRPKGGEKPGPGGRRGRGPGGLTETYEAQD